MNFKLKHLTELLSETPNMARIMSEVCGYNNNWVGRRFVFAWKFKQALKLWTDYRSLNPKDAKENPDCEIKRPNNIDNISFMAMLDVQRLLSKPSDDVTNLISELITKVCYIENVEGDYKPSSEQYRLFKEKVLNSDLKDMFGLYNWIDKALKESQESWNERFLSVEVIDKDYEQAGGKRMAQFNAITTIETLCGAFNVTYDEAWQMPYAIVQTRSYKQASANYTQEQMRILKEARMRQERQSQSR